MGFNDAPGLKQEKRNQELRENPDKAHEYSNLIRAAEEQGMEIDQAIKHFDVLIALAESEPPSVRLLAELKIIALSLKNISAFFPSKDKEKKLERLKRVVERIDEIENSSAGINLARIKKIAGVRKDPYQS